MSVKTNQDTQTVKVGQSSLWVPDGDVPQALDVLVEQGVRLDLVMLHRQSAVCRHVVVLQANSTLNLFYLALGGDEVVQNLHVDLQGENAECNIFAFSAAALSQRYSADFFVKHSVANCRSTQLF